MIFKAHEWRTCAWVVVHTTTVHLPLEDVFGEFWIEFIEVLKSSLLEVATHGGSKYCMFAHIYHDKYEL